MKLFHEFNFICGYAQLEVQFIQELNVHNHSFTPLDQGTPSVCKQAVYTWLGPFRQGYPVTSNKLK